MCVPEMSVDTLSIAEHTSREAKTARIRERIKKTVRWYRTILKCWHKTHICSLMKTVH